MAETLHAHWLIIGAGPYGLAAAAWAKAHGVDHLVVGRTMQFWRDHMPSGMFLRSGADWHLDPTGRDTFQEYARQNNLPRETLKPIALDVFIDYVQWFVQRKGLAVREDLVQRLDRDGRQFIATLVGGGTIAADRVLIAAGFRDFVLEPAEYTAMLPAGRWCHTCHVGSLDRYTGKRVAIIGGRQSAFETAALLREAGAARVDVIHRHDTPRFETSDWSWVPAMVKRTIDEPDWFASLPPTERDALGKRFWTQGRLRLEPWLGPRVHRDGIVLHPNARVIGCDADMNLTLDTGEQIATDHVILATGYRVDVGRLPYLKDGNVLGDIATDEGFPILDSTFQSSVAGLYFTSLAATRRFGPFFGFVVGAPAAATLVGRAIAP